MFLDSSTYESLWKQALDPKERGASVFLMRIFLYPVCILFQSARAFKHAIFRWGLFPRTRLSAFTLSIGNLTMGGAGKTPLAIWMTRFFSETLREDTVVLNRGFRSGNRKAVLPLSRKGDFLVENPLIGGDEASLLAKICKKASVIVGKVRAYTGSWACKEWGVSVVILDDAYQYWRLERDLNIVVVNALSGFGNGRLFPLGTLREPLEALKRADMVVLNHANIASREQIDSINNLLDTYARRAKRVQGAYFFSAFRSICPASGGVEQIENSELSVLIVTGVGRPESVPFIVEKGGLKVVDLMVMNDHYRFTSKDWARVEQRAHQVGAKGIIVTGKDEANLPESLQATATLPIWVLDVKSHYEGIGFDLETFLQEQVTACSYLNDRGSVSSTSDN